MPDLGVDLLAQVIAAFSGAFFAFLFVRLADFLSRIYQRRLTHYNTLVFLDLELNELLSIIHDNLYIAPRLRQTILSGNVSMDEFDALPMNRDRLTQIADLDLSNELFIFHDQLRALSDDLQKANQTNAALRNGRFSGNIGRDQYLANAKYLTSAVTMLEGFLEFTLEECLRLLARVRLQVRTDAPLGARAIRRLTEVRRKPSQEAIESEVAKLRKELEQTAAESRRRIGRVLERQHQPERMV